MITTEQFTNAIQACISAEEFAEQGHLLDVIQPEHREAFILCLSLGTPLRECFKQVEEMIKEMGKAKGAVRLQIM